MILRRLTRSLQAQDWTTVTLEFVLLVCGVFLGIQAANWNEARADDARARAYLARIRGNLETDALSIERRVVFWRQVIDYGNQAIRYAETGTLVDGSAWKTVLAFHQASQLWQWVSADATYQEMRSGGELGLIRDEQLREALSQYYLESGSAVAYLFDVQPDYRRIVRGLTPSVVSHHIWARCWQQPSPTEQHLLDCAAPIPEAEAQAVLDGYMKNPDLLPELRFWVANQGVALDVIAGYKPLLREMLERQRKGSQR
ncbi:MAG: hypothetical protein EOP93_12595 [Lysobacteraceae bacterium]|nr:MAG: hypothetical protein EOP93_12595 [Xanthomonadaceae bacterium]